PNVPTTTSSPFSAGLAAVDLRTGKQLWKIDTNEIIVFGWLMQFHTIQEYGTQAFLVTAYNSSMWRLRDPMTGYVIANITNVPSTTAAGLVDTNDDNAQGAVLIHSISGGNLTLWNSTQALCNYGSFGGMTIRPSGNINYTQGQMWSVQVVNNLNGNSIRLSIAGRTNKYVLLRDAPNLATQSGAGYAVEAGYDAMSGKLLWGPVNRTFPVYHEVTLLATGEEWYVEHDKDTNQAYVFSLLTGQQIGGVIQLPGNALAVLERGGAIAYGKCYVWDFGGYVNAIELSNGTLAWTYVARDANYDTPYGIYPLWHFGSHSIADGKLFLSESRMYDPPLFPNAHKQAINVTDGSRVWSVLGFFGREPGAIADGYMVGYNSYDAQIYTFGKGPTAISLSASPKVSVYGSSVVIEGTITDESSGTRDDDRSARFPNGVPVVSEESQSAWMEYVYMQQPKPTNATGVPIKLSVLDSNGNYREIGSTTSDKDGFYTFKWTPDIEGQFTVYASFDGSESYWPTHAVTSFAVDPAAPTPVPTEALKLSTTDQYFAPAVAGIIVVIAIGFAVTILVLRKRQ
ncbi:MAG TPA: hypothetical protein VK253_07165, partial [Candidatus Binatia bacterium]|nr:hypothetical protein [Candidatus Binatia bacterium]